MTRRRSTVDANVGANENGGRAWYTLVHRHLLRFGDGAEQGFLVHERQTGLGVMVVEPPENLPIRFAVEHIRKRVADAQVPALLDRIEKGRQVTFGPLTADAHGLFVPGAADWRIGGCGHGDPHRTEVPAWEVVNWCALVALWKRLRPGGMRQTPSTAPP